MHRLIAGGGGGDDHRVNAVPARKGFGTRQDIFAARRAYAGGTELFRQRDFLRIEIDANDPATLRMQQLHRQQANQAETHYRDGLAQSRIGEPYALKRDGANHCECCCVVTDVVGDMRDEVLPYANHFGVTTI